MLTYPFQTAPLSLLGPGFLDDADVIIRRTVKSILGLPASTNNAMLYAPRRWRGLGLLRCLWEAPLQHISIAQKLSGVPDDVFQKIFNGEEEITACFERLGESQDGNSGSVSTRKMRKALREKVFEEWTRCKWQGLGVNHFKDNPKFNRFIYEKHGLSESEWINALKLNINYAPLRGVPGVSSSGAVAPLCRHCGRERESPAHVLGSCAHNMQLVTRRHHNVKNFITDLLREKGFQCFEEVYALDEDNTPRYADIVAFDNASKAAYILDPTIRFENNDPDQASKINEEKKEIYEKCIPYLSEKYRDQFGERNFLVQGLWFGTRGTIPVSTSQFLEQLGVDVQRLFPLAESIIVDTLSILRYHIYS